MNQDKPGTARANSNDLTWESPEIHYKKRVYKLRSISYMGLSIMYIALIVITAVFGLAFLAYFSANNNVIALILVALLCGGIIMSFFHIGNRYGEYGLEIILGKFFQVRRIRNDYPRIRKHLLSDMELFPEQTLTLIQASIKSKDESNEEVSKDSSADKATDPSDENSEVSLDKKENV